MKTITSKSISHTYASNLVIKAVDEAEVMGIAISACVVDTHGRVKAKITMDNAALIADELVEKKARTALLGMSSQDFGQAVKGIPEFSNSMLQLSSITMLGGGYPLFDDGEVVGAFAVGGATVEQDIACAEAALGDE